MNKEKLHKTDTIDCNKLARELRSGSLEVIYVPRTETLEMRSLIRRRNLIVKDNTHAKNCIKSLLHFHGGGDSEKVYPLLNRLLVKTFLELSMEYGKKTPELQIKQFIRLRGMFTGHFYQ